MKIFNAIGLALGIIFLKILMPEVASGLESTLVKLFATLVDVMGEFPNLDQTAMILPHAVPLPR